MKFSASRKRVALIWALSGIVAAEISSIISMVYWQYSYIPEANVNWQPINDIFGMVFILPFGLLLSIVMPWGWVSLVGLFIALWLKDIRPIAFSLLGSIYFGYEWPKWFVGLMGI
jgi:hypothetical protein